MKLYSYFRSSAAYRVRIGLNLKSLAYETAPVHLVKNEQQSEDYLKLNRSALVPTLVDGDLTLSQSLSILEYLDEQYPETKLLPNDVKERAKIRAFAQAIACDIHPLNNLRVLKYLKNDLNVSDEQKIIGISTGLLKAFKVSNSNFKIQTGNFALDNKQRLPIAA